MPFRWPTDPPGKPPRHSIPWSAYHGSKVTQQQSTNRNGFVNTYNAAHPAAPYGSAGWAALVGNGQGPMGSNVPAPPAPNPRDAQYTGELGSLVANRKNILAGIGRERTVATQDRDDALKRLVEGRSQSLLNGKRGANNRGLFYSTFLTNQNRDTNRDYDDQQTGVQRAFKSGEDDRIARQSEAERLYGKTDTDYGSEGARLLREAIQRALERQLGLAA